MDEEINKFIDEYEILRKATWISKSACVYIHPEDISKG